MMQVKQTGYGCFPQLLLSVLIIFGACFVAEGARGYYGMSDQVVHSQKGNVIGTWVIGYFIVVFLIWLAFKIRREIRLSRAIRSINTPIFTRPEISKFYRNTIQAWSQGRYPPFVAYLRGLPKIRDDCSVEEFVKQFRLYPASGSALNILFTRFVPHPDEFLIDLGNEPFHCKNPGWCVVTNNRIVQKDGASRRFQEIPLHDLCDLSLTSDEHYLALDVTLKSGETIAFSKLEMAPSPEEIKQLIQWVARKERVENSPE